MSSCTACLQTLTLRRSLPGWGTLAASLFAALSAKPGADPAADGTGPAVDVHAHFYPLRFLQALAEGGGPPAFPVHFETPEQPVVRMGALQLTLDPTYWDLEQRLARMDAQGVQVQALSLTAPMVHWAPPERGAELARIVNDAMAEAHAAHPGRFVGCVVMPLQDPMRALAELERVAGSGAFRGVYFPTHIDGKELSDPSLFPLYARCQELGFPVLLHPVGVIGAERLRPFYLNNLLGNPFESAIAAAHLVFGGVLDRFPRLDVVLPHAGGALPILWGRLTHGQGVRPETRNVAQQPFRDYLRRFHYDTIGHAPEVVRTVVGLVGSDRVVLGSDYCFDMGTERPREMVGQLGLPAAEQERILGGNAARLLRL